MKILAIFLSCSCVLLSILPTGGAADTIAANQTVRDGDTLVSADESFELGFFSPDDSNNRYVGIWYKKVANGTVVWVANRETHVNDTSGVLKLTDRGTLQILAGNDTVIWSSNSSVSAGNPTAQILDTGNLVVRDETRVSIWESFDHPGDTFLPGMKIGKDLSTGKDRFLTSWASTNDPSEGEYSIRVDTDGFPQLFERRRSETSVPQSRFGPWNGVTFNGMPNLGEDSILTHRFVIDSDEVYYEYDLMNSSLVSRMVVNPDGNIVRLNWIDRNRGWVLYSTATIDACSRYGICGPFGNCNINNAPACSCMDGFKPRRPEEWNVADWSSGCRRKESIDCGNGDGFRRVSGVKFPDTSRSWYNVTATLPECEAACRRNCSCTAYAGLDIRRGGSGCLLWFDDLVDIRVYDESQELYVRMAASELTGIPASESGSHTKKKTIAVAVSTSLGLVSVGVVIALCVAWNKRTRSRAARQRDPAPGVHANYTDESHKEDTDLSSFSLSTITKATHDFAIGNKLGEGGFGPVYKGVLEDGREVAVKRLSKTSIQGLDEFKNEVRFIARLQHRNLVRLLGYCTQGDERMLIYEYMPNKSLDSFIFDKPEGSMLDWPQRFRVIHGIARGLLYLHQDSRLRIIHRDLKAGNVLLDRDMNPKISDFGLARRFSGYETEGNTNNVVGTYGYISPEYAVHGLFSVKSDVFSFGVLVLEIVSGKKNRGFAQQEHDDTLLGHAWRLHKDDRSLELVSPTLRHTFVDSEVLRSIHIGLLCVQHHAEDRPTMSSVVLMLGNDNALPPPKQPAFFTDERLREYKSVSSTPTLDSVNEVTITLLNAR